MCAACTAGRLKGEERLKGSLGKKGLQSERGSGLSGTKVGHLGKGKPPRGYHSVCQELFTVLSLNGSVLQKLSDVLKVEERESDNSKLQPEAGGKCGKEHGSFSLYSEPSPGRHTLIMRSCCLRG